MKKFFINWHKSKTQWLNGSIVLVGLVSTNIEEFRNLIPTQYFGIFLVLVGIIGWYLRTITTTPLKDK